ncbi:hypothetical protein JIG36_36265 [Actinoplanes sp. LDG1-06]|uniref:Uncharacterized protein n=1 Tax=Paractinoplanes ovalisporus TaxID=2810368 RepID=A0ABS2AM73_9ACTN|nr:hypothetical protein [Actinoplanes ovalisporus]MBM2620969.1 hypothetical protein [Actinoplanes ovalisporus]
MGKLRYATAAVAVIYTGFASAYIGDALTWRVGVGWFAAGVAVTVAPLFTRRIRAFRLACRIEAVIVFLLNVVCFMVVGLLLLPALVPLVVAAAKSHRADTAATLALVTVAVACFSAAILGCA